jgi:hypothetical protein
LWIEKNWSEGSKEPTLTYGSQVSGVKPSDVRRNRIRLRWIEIDDEVYINGKPCQEIPED